MFVTEDKILLRKRRWYESHFPGGQLNIINIFEAIEIMDLFLKKRDKYCISPNYFTNKYDWYWYSFRLKIPFFHVQTNKYDPLNSFSSKFVFTLMSIDEMGFQYYNGVNYQTGESMIYHFNYFLSLITGIFDSLALFVFQKYQISFEKDKNPLKISLRSSTGKEFLKEIKKNNHKLRELISKYANFINLMFELRNPIIHGQNSSNLVFEDRDEDGIWKACLIEITTETKQMIQMEKDQSKKYDLISEWGLKDMHGMPLLSPYEFSKKSIIRLIEFSNYFLESIEFGDYIKKLNNIDEFSKTINRFKKLSLGFEGSISNDHSSSK